MFFHIFFFFFSCVYDVLVEWIIPHQYFHIPFHIQLYAYYCIQARRFFFFFLVWAHNNICFAIVTVLHDATRIGSARLDSTRLWLLLLLLLLFVIFFSIFFFLETSSFGPFKHKSKMFCTTLQSTEYTQ